MNQDGLNHFDNDLLWAKWLARLPLWRVLYQQKFPDMIDMWDHSEHRTLQRLGFDRTILLADNKRVFIEEKARRPNANGESYADICIEYISNIATKSPGWAIKPTDAGYFAYAILAAGKAYLFPARELQQAWLRFGKEWIARKKPIKSVSTRANGETWHALSVGVSVNEVYSAIRETLCLNFEPVTEQFETDSGGSETTQQQQPPPLSKIWRSPPCPF